MSELVVTNANLPMAIRWWAKTHGECSTHPTLNESLQIIMDLVREKVRHRTVLTLQPIPDDFQIALDISNLAAPVQEALQDSFSQEVIDIEELATIYNYDE